MRDLSPQTKSALIELLSSSLGDEKAAEAVATAAAALGLGSEALDHAEAMALLERIAETPGLVGIAARFAKSRLFGQRVTQRNMDVVVAKPDERSADDEMSAPAYTRAELAALFRSSLGNEKAAEVIDSAASALDFDGDAFDSRQALRILDWLAHMQGLVGIAARFAKSRLLLKG